MTSKVIKAATFARYSKLSSPALYCLIRPSPSNFQHNKLNDNDAQRQRFHSSSYRALQHKPSAVDDTKLVQEHLEKYVEAMKAAKTTNLETLNVSDVEAPHVGIIRILSLNRPAARNAISRQLLKELDEQVEAIYQQVASGNVRVLIIASESDESFCAGADLKERATMSPDEVTTFLASLRRTFSRLADLPIPTISCISGTALGGGLELALCTHLRVLSSNALLGLPETRLGIIPGAGGTYRLPAVIGTARALEWILTGQQVHAAAAIRAGLGRQSWNTGEFHIQESLDLKTKRLLALGRTVDVAKQIAKGAPLALAAALRAVKGPGGPSEVAENVAYDSLLHSEDRMEALKAFGEKRQPSFKGR